ncbi:MAG: MtrB/PioB family outer membrane beta-barrel protein [Candidatus Methylomirabilis sp.]|nr:MtrB/PioB family outer membrane beta-barrel protein [Candidatus Methylomirabilis sp.]
MSTGTYERRLVPGLGDTFRVLGIEPPEPLDHQTTQIGFATDLSGDGWIVNLGYDYMNFSNDTTRLHWQNPFNNTDELAPGAGAFNRGRFAEAQIQLFPDNHSHAVTGSGSVFLPFKTQFTGSLSHTWLFQDDRFLPFTLNSAILATNAPGSPRRRRCPCRSVPSTGRSGS